MVYLIDRFGIQAKRKFVQKLLSKVNRTHIYAILRPAET